MSEQESVRVNFGRPFPVFPLQHVVLLPHAVISLFVFEERYRQMVSDVLDGPGQIALGVYDGDAFLHDYEGSPPIMPAVCVGQIVHHQQNADGTYNILLQGVCRAEIIDEQLPAGERLYRQAELRPLDSPSETSYENSCCDFLREQLRQMLSAGPIGALEPVQRLREQLDEREDDIDADVFFDLMALCLFSMLEGDELRYQLLAESDPTRRAQFVHRELKNLNDTLENAERQFDPDAPKGVSWN
jgi:Lon protease-like protein